MLAPDRINACQHHIKGKRRPGQTIRKRTWPRQDDVTVSQQRLWTRYIAAAFLRYSNHWRQTPILHETPPRENKITPTQKPTLHSYLSTLPKYHHFYVYTRPLYSFASLTTQFLCFYLTRIFHRIRNNSISTYLLDQNIPLHP